MKTTIALAAGLSLMMGAAACGGGGSGDDTPQVDAAGGGPDAGGGSWKTLVSGAWSMPSHQEGYYCVYATVPNDVYIKAFRPVIPNGTHHTVLTTFTGANPPDGVVPCDAATNGQSMIFGSGVGSIDYAFPPGVAVHLTAGTRLILNLHLFNTTDNALNGTSGTLYQEANAAEIQNVAEMVLAGPTFTLQVPTGTSTQTGNCTVSGITSVPIQVFSLSQHMHKLGTHMKSTLVRGGTPTVLQDIDYSFGSQVFHDVSPFIELRPGDTLTTACTYVNTAATHPPSGAPVTFGQSSNDEMCFTDLFYYPAQAANFICTN